jgi:phage terminase large subunit
VLVTWERDILGPSHPLLNERPVLRRVRQSYDFPNGSAVIVGGIDKPGKILSSEYDLIYAPEATDLTIEDWETLSGRLRAAAVPYQQIVADCNPTTPTHWLYKRCGSGTGSGLCKLFPTTHRDNPRYWDDVKGEWTELGKQYLARLERLTGPRRKRFLEGIWAAAEGLVYDGYNPAIHNHPPGWKPPKDWPRVWGIDWGFVNPTALLMIAVDGDGRMHVYREYYQTHRRAEEVAKWAKGEIESGREPRPLAMLCDHDPECAASFRAHGPSGVGIILADKGDKIGGIEMVQERFDLAEDGKPRIYLVPDMLAHRADQSLEDAGKPTGLMSEIVGYIWDVHNPDRIKDEPLDVNSHSCDALRYAAKWIESHFQKAPKPQKPRPPVNLFGRLPSNTWH